MKKCFIITGGEPSALPSIDENDFVIACDKGYGYAENNGVIPSLVIGDFDSYEGELPKNIPVMRLKCEKDDTDTMTAVRYAVANGYKDIVLCCALGGRLDHELANIQSALYAVRRGVKVSIFGKDSNIYFLRDESRKFSKNDGCSLSVFSATDSCSGVFIKGAKYPLKNAVITSDFPIGVSNEWTEADVEISVKNGILMVVESVKEEKQ